VARQQEKIGNCRKDALEKLTTRLVTEFDVICIEDLNLRGMVKNHSLARSLSDARATTPSTRTTPLSIDRARNERLCSGNVRARKTSSREPAAAASAVSEMSVPGAKPVLSLLTGCGLGWLGGW
jgi:hypothetical protein